MTRAELAMLPRDCFLRFGDNPTRWRYLGFSERRQELMVTRPNGLFVKAAGIPVAQIANIQVVELPMETRI